MDKIAKLFTVSLISFCGLSFAAEYTVKQKTRAKAIMMNVQELESFLINSSDLEMTDELGFTILFNIALSRDSEILEKWIKAGANVNAVSNTGNTPLFLAVLSNQLDSIKILVESGANVNHKKNNGNNVLLFAIQRPNLVRAETVISLINHGADVNALNSDGKSPLHLIRERKEFRWAIQEKSIERLLIQKGAKDISGFQNQKENKNLDTTSSNGTKVESNSNHHSKEVYQSSCSNSDRRNYQKGHSRWASDSECIQKENYNPMK